MLSGLLASKLLYSITLTLIHFLWQGGVIAIALKIALMITPSQKPQLRYAWSFLAMLLCLVIPLATFYFIYTANVTLHIALLDTVMPISHSELSLLSDNWLQSLHTLSPYIALSWIGVSALLALKLSLELYQVRRLSLANALSPSKQLQDQFITLVHDLKMTRVPRLIISLKTDVPMAIGVFKPIVLIPLTMLSGLTPAQLNMLMLHELAHIQRHDYLMNILQTLIETLLFFHPCCYWISNQVRKEREYCCDDVAVKHCHDPIAYAHTLADTASICHHNHSIPKMAMAASGGDLKQRIMRLVKKDVECTSALYFPKGLAVLGILLMSLSMSVQFYVTLPSSAEIVHTENKFINSNTYENLETKVLTQDIALINQLTFTHTNNIEQVSTIPLQQVLLVSQSGEITQATASVSSIKQNNTEPFTGTKVSEVEPADTEIAKAPQTNELSLPKKPSVNDPAVVKNVLALKAEPQPRLPSQKKQENQTKLIAQKVEEPAPTQFITPEKKVQEVATLPSVENQKNNELLVQADPEMSVKNDAELIKAIEPRYPAAAQRRGLELDVLVNFTVNTEGKVEDIEFKSHSKSHYFKNSIRSAMKKWRFLPAQQNGKPVESTMTKIFSFNLFT